ncbi:MAG TPA: hypothetical protein VLW85_03865 [Myxococcales bacterium]|nr:hypothetical protein [Myxococcales bacterium]
MDERPKDNKPATEFGEVKVIKDDPKDPAGKTPGSAERGGLDDAQKSGPGKTPGKAEG